MNPICGRNAYRWKHRPLRWRSLPDWCQAHCSTYNWTGGLRVERKTFCCQCWFGRGQTPHWGICPTLWLYHRIRNWSWIPYPRYLLHWNGYLRHIGRKYCAGWTIRPNNRWTYWNRSSLCHTPRERLQSLRCWRVTFVSNKRVAHVLRWRVRSIYRPRGLCSVWSWRRKIRSGCSRTANDWRRPEFRWTSCHRPCNALAPVQCRSLISKLHRLLLFVPIKIQNKRRPQII